MTNQEIIDAGQVIFDEESVGANTSERVGAVIKGIGQNLIAEENARTSADTDLGHRIDDEETARLAAESGLGGEIDAEIAARQNADNTLGGRIDAEALARQNADNALGGRIDGLSDDLADEVQDLQDAISSEESNRQSADNNLGDAISDETLARQNADNTLGGRIDAEKTARENADNTLGGRIDAEKTARENADNALDGRIDDLSDDLADEVQDRQTAITNEETARQQADLTLGGRIDTEKSARETADGELGTRITGLSDGLVAEESAREAADNAEIAAREAAVAAEAAAREAAVEGLGNTNFLLSGCKGNVFDKSYVRVGKGIHNLNEDASDGKIVDEANSCITGYYKIPEEADVLHISGAKTSGNPAPPLKIRFVSQPSDDIQNVVTGGELVEENVFISPIPNDGIVDVNLNTFRASHPTLKYFCATVYRNGETSAKDTMSVILEDTDETGKVKNEFANFNLFSAESAVGVTRADLVKNPEKAKDFFLIVKADIPGMAGQYNVIGRINGSSEQTVLAHLNDNKFHYVAVDTEYDYFQIYYADNTVAYTVYYTFANFEYELDKRVALLEETTTHEVVVIFSGYTSFNNAGNAGKLLVCYYDSESVASLNVVGRTSGGVDTTIGSISSGVIFTYLIEDNTYTRIFFKGATSEVTLHYAVIDSGSIQSGVYESISNVNESISNVNKRVTTLEKNNNLLTDTFTAAYHGVNVSNYNPNGKYLVGYYKSNDISQINVVGTIGTGSGAETHTLGWAKSGELFAFALEYDFTHIYWQNKIDATKEVTIRYKITTDEYQAIVNKCLNDLIESGVSPQVFKPKVRMLAIGDSFTAPYTRWLQTAFENYFSSDSSLVNLAVVGATVRDKYTDRTTYPYTSRPNKDASTGNLNVFACQIEKLKRLMLGQDLDPGETQIYTDPSEYPNVIVIAGGMNDANSVKGADTDQEVASYHSQLLKQVTAYFKTSASDTNPSTTSTGYIKTPLAELDRLTFAGAYRYLIEELLTLFPKAQVFISTVAPLNAYSKDFVEVTRNIAQQQRYCADMFSASIIDWHQNVQTSIVNNYPSGSGTQNDPYILSDIIDATGDKDNVDIGDYIHPNSKAGKKYGHIAGKVISSMFMDIESFE